MSALPDLIDRISDLAKSIRANSPSTSARVSPGPFTRAVLDTPLGDLIRDIHPAELGLFTLATPSVPVVSNPHPTTHAKPHHSEPVALRGGELARIEFPGATPLRKPPAPHGSSSRAGISKLETQRPREHEPEVYAHAALKYLDRYQSIRPMPRASEQVSNLISVLDTVRANIQTLNDKLKQHESAGPSSPLLSPASVIKKEEKKIHSAQTRISELKKRKAVLEKKRRDSRSTHFASHSSNPKTPSTPMSPQDIQEETFWNTPGAGARTLHFKGDSLLDEKVDFGVGLGGAMDFISPGPVPGSSSGRIDHRSEFSGFNVRNAASPLGDELPSGRDDEELGEVLTDDDVLDDNILGGTATEAQQDDDATIVLGKVPPREGELPGPSGSSFTALVPNTATATSAKDEESPHSRSVSSPPRTQDQTAALSLGGTPLDGTKRAKLKVTTELEHAVGRIWATIGELVMPGHQFDVSGRASGNSKSKPPRAKETVAYLRSLSNSTPAPPSPTASSLSSLVLTTQPSSPSSSQPSPQQILTAHMLLALLESPPSYSMALSKLKDVVAAKAAEIGGRASVAGGGIGTGAGGATKPIYGCVAKRLLKIDRGRGEQVVKFDM